MVVHKSDSAFTLLTKFTIVIGFFYENIQYSKLDIVLLEHGHLFLLL